MVKRLLPGKGGKLSILSDNPAFAPIEDVEAKDVAVVGRVVWVGRKL
jgi:phage repressor protein C with HTH and peptisase S24 domain